MMTRMSRRICLSQLYVQRTVQTGIQTLNQRSAVHLLNTIGAAIMSDGIHCGTDEDYGQNENYVCMVRWHPLRYRTSVDGLHCDSDNEFQ